MKKQIKTLYIVIIIIILAISVYKYNISHTIIEGYTCDNVPMTCPKCKTISVLPPVALCCGENQVITYLNTCCTKRTCGTSSCGYVSDGCGGTIYCTEGCGGGGGGSNPYCGDGSCNNAETCSSCSSDCGACPKKSDGEVCSLSSECENSNCVHGICRSFSTYCGDTYCDSGETCSSCSSDCGYCQDCTPDWDCGSWSSCPSGTQTRTCTDLNDCGTSTNKPATSQSCIQDCTPDNSCADNTCIGQTCVNNCGQNISGTKSCTTNCTPDWKCGAWSTCSGGVQTRTCTDYNTCNTESGKPSTYQSCTQDCTPECDNKCGGVPSNCEGITCDAKCETTPRTKYITYGIITIVIVTAIILYKIRRKK